MTKGPRKKTKKSKEGPNWNFYYYWKTNHKIDLKDKIESIKTLTKKKQNKKLKVEGPNQKILYIEIRIEGLNWKNIKL